MLWDQELSRLAERKQVLVTESEQLRTRVRGEASAVAARLRWVEVLGRVGSYVRPALVMGAALVGYRGVARKSRLLGALGAGVAGARVVWGLVRGRR